MHTLSARPSRCSHCSHLSSSSSFLDTHSRYLACNVAMPSSTSCRRCFASPRTFRVTSRSSWASRKACCRQQHGASLSGAPGEPSPPLPTAVPSPHPLGLHSLGHEVVLVHSAHPLADGGAGLGHLGDGSWLELLIVDVWLDGFDHCLPDVVLGMETGGFRGCFPGRMGSGVLVRSTQSCFCAPCKPQYRCPPQRVNMTEQGWPKEQLMCSIISDNMIGEFFLEKQPASI